MAVVLLLGVGTSLNAQALLPEVSVSASAGEFVGVAWHAADYVLEAPCEWERTEWLEFGGVTLLIAGTGVLLDHQLKNHQQHEPETELGKFAGHFERFGVEYSYGVIAAFYAGGLATGNARHKRIGEDALISSVVAGGITLALKKTLGRSRPDAEHGTFHFSPFGGGNSFPSGHATQAFAVASVIAAHYDDNPWVDTAVYGAAALVGVSRLNHNKHYLSDVLAGAIIGHFVGRAVVHSRPISRDRLAWTPVVRCDFVGLSGSFDF